MARSKIEDLRGATALAVQATKGVMSLVQEMHRNIASGPDVLGSPFKGPSTLITGAVYGTMKGVTGLVGVGLDQALTRLQPLLDSGAPRAERSAVRAALNGVLGDYLADTNNPLAIEMEMRRNAEPVDLDDPVAREASLTDAGEQLLVMVHGSCMNDRLWLQGEHDHGAALARDLGYTRVDLLYNSGLHVSENGRGLATRLEKLVKGWPVALGGITFVGHSMGGLVSRSACAIAEQEGHAWRKNVRALVCLGSPHHGASLEQGGNWIDVLLGATRYTAPLARLGKIRSAGITDLRFGNVLDEHWMGQDRFEQTEDTRTPVPLPKDVACFAVAGAKVKGAGDGLVRVKSALGQHEDPERTLAFPEDHTLIARGVGHLGLLEGGEVYETMRDWLASTR